MTCSSTRRCPGREGGSVNVVTNNFGLLGHHSSIIHPLLYVLLLLFDDMLYCVTNGPKVEAGAA